MGVGVTDLVHTDRSRDSTGYEEKEKVQICRAA